MEEYAFSFQLKTDYETENIVMLSYLSEGSDIEKIITVTTRENTHTQCHNDVVVFLSLY